MAVPTIKMGGGPNPPARMGPNVRIVNVHWTKLHYIAVKYGIPIRHNANFWSNPAFSCGNTASPPAGDGNHWSSQSIADAEYAIDGDELLLGIKGWSDSAEAWTHSIPDDYEVSGLPTVSGSVSFGLMLYYMSFYAAPESLWIMEPVPWWHAAGGASVPDTLPVPDFSPEEVFDESTSRTFGMLATPYLQPSECYLTRQYSHVGPDLPNLTAEIGGVPVDFSGVTVTTNGGSRTFNAVATKVVGENSTTGHLQFNAAGQLWILCKLQEEGTA